MSFFDIYQIRKFDEVMAELEGEDDTSMSMEYDDPEGLGDAEDLDEAVALSKHQTPLSSQCVWEDETESGEVRVCGMPVAVVDGVMDELCIKHLQQEKEEDELLKRFASAYIQNVRKTIEPALLKQLDKDFKGWKSYLSEALGITSQKLTAEIKKNPTVPEKEFVDSLFSEAE
jgi:hypothetical protein